MPLNCTNPLEDDRWVELLETHPQASIFHSRGWLEALRRTYGYQPVVFTSSVPSAPLVNGLVCTRVSSWLTGSRLVSLAFSDHCQPLARTPQDLETLVERLPASFAAQKCSYIELRPLSLKTGTLGSRHAFNRSATFCFHALDLNSDIETLFQGLHKSCVRRKIQRARAEGLRYEQGRSEALLRNFYALLILTRQRHGIIPQPFKWFHNLVACLNDAVTIRMVFKDDKPIASIMTLHYKDQIVYKYGCSDARYHKLGGMPFLFWATIQEGKRLGAKEFDLGRSNHDQKSLIDFKNRLGARSHSLDYYRFPSHAADKRHEKTGFVLTLGARAPLFVRRTAGNLLYRHIG